MVNVSSRLFVGLISLAALSMAVPATRAHNPAKYTGIPFVVPAACQNFDSGVSAQVVTSGGRAKLQSVVDTDGNAGVRIFCSNPGTPRQNFSPPIITATFPQGTLTFNVSGIPSDGNLQVEASFADSSSSFAQFLPGNGFVSVPINGSTTLGSPVRYILVVGTSGSASFATVYFSNFAYNASPLLFDTTAPITECLFG
jgi:hypothetical protein